MKLFLFILMLIPLALFAQDDPEPATEKGEYLDMNGVGALFKESETLEEFEEKLNTQENEVNNLDLNKNGEVDSLRVLESVDGNTQLIVIQAVLGKNAYQEVATIEVDKTEDGNTYVIIVGDKSIYGDNYVFDEKAEEEAKKKSEEVKLELDGGGIPELDGGENEKSSVSGYINNFGMRRVLYKPLIKDAFYDSGDVNVQVCVDGNGQVISAKNTMRGSTTINPQLVEIAIAGAKKYKFEKSSVDKQCGSIKIKFRVK